MQAKDERTKHWGLVLCGFVCIALFTRMYSLGDRSPWGDEIHTIGVCLGDQFLGKVFQDHGVIHYLLMLLGRSCVADTLAGFRLPTVLVGVLLVTIVWVLARRFLNMSSCVLAVSLVSLSAYHVQLSQELRTYGPLATCSALATLYLLRLHERRSRAGTIWYGFAIALGLLTDPVPFGAVVLAHFVWWFGVGWHRREWSHAVVVAWTVGGILFAPVFLASYVFAQNVATSGNWAIFRSRLTLPPVVVVDNILQTTLRTLGFFLSGYTDFQEQLTHYGLAVRYGTYWAGGSAFLLVVGSLLRDRRLLCESKARQLCLLTVAFAVPLGALATLPLGLLPERLVTACALGLPLPLLILGGLGDDQNGERALYALVLCFPFLIQGWVPLDPRHFSVSYFAFILLVSAGVDRLPGRIPKIGIASVLVVLSLWGLVFYGGQRLYPLHEEDWTSLAGYLETVSHFDDAIIVSVEPEGFSWLYSGDATVVGLKQLGIAPGPLSNPVTEAVVLRVQRRLAEMQDDSQRLWIAYQHYASPAVLQALDGMNVPVRRIPFGQKLDLYQVE